MHSKHSAFTMIELIFVIVILGILASVAIPRLAATRDDAKKVQQIANVQTCVTDMAAMYTATKSFSLASSSACVEQSSNAAATAMSAVATNSSVVTVTGTSTSLDGAHTFGGTSVSF